MADEEIFNDNYLHIDFVLKYAIKSKVVKYIKNIPLPENFKTPKYYRISDLFGDGWQIVDSETLIETLTDEQLKLSSWGIWNDTLIIEKL
ncbi:MAG: hypothetical protein HRT68_01860 [Flavobacteriaceae bacterium]|nr:hypothetical protein [Flavobacteriaceae bacterium]